MRRKDWCSLTTAFAGETRLKEQSKKTPPLAGGSFWLPPVVCWRLRFPGARGALAHAPQIPRLRVSNVAVPSLRATCAKIPIGVFDPFTTISPSTPCLDQSQPPWAWKPWKIGTGGYPNNHHCHSTTRQDRAQAKALAEKV